MEVYTMVPTLTRMTEEYSWPHTGCNYFSERMFYGLVKSTLKLQTNVLEVWFEGVMPVDVDVIAVQFLGVPFVLILKGSLGFNSMYTSVGRIGRRE